MNKIVFLIGESGSGKTHLQEKLMETHPCNFTRIISTTTRPPREGEVNGEHYHFVSEDVFANKIEAGELLQWVNFGNTFYGTELVEYKQPESIGLFVCTPEGVNDTIEALKNHPFAEKFSYQIVFFLANKNLLKKHGVSQERIDRGNLTENFIQRFYNDEFLGIKTKIILPTMVDKYLHLHVSQTLLGHIP